MKWLGWSAGIALVAGPTFSLALALFGPAG